MESTIHVFGDSHASHIHSHWGYISIPNVNIKCYHLGGKLMYTFGRLGLNLLNIKKYNIQEKDTVIFCFGEIDCRNHVHKHITTTKSYKDIINEIVEKYFISILENVLPFPNIKTCVYNVVPPHRYIHEAPNHPFPFLGSDEERKQYYQYMNEKIREYCITYNLIYFDIYDQSCDSSGFLKEEYSDGNVHLRNTTHSIEFIKKNILSNDT